ncbi:hypothetical protein GCM10014715_74830 [Streptomyces spiralis]|uniref:Uncharacterized protein n=1 Tax=Streptomyces spiralis TaxID=66376 RepID=A0A919E0Z1_9ACTN|nr:hypothetical protein GCM10014715_74830 [Streptomyces spiralis]
MRGRWKPPHAARIIGRTRTCPNGPRFASRDLALAALLGWVGPTQLEATACHLCDGWHHTPAPR